MDFLYYASFDARDALEQAEGPHDGQQQFEQLSGGAFAGHVDDLCIGPVQVFHERLNQTVFQSGAPRPGSITLAQAGSTAMPADVQFELTVPAGMDLVAIAIDRSALPAAAGRLGRKPALPTRPCVAAESPTRRWTPTTAEGRR